MYNSDILVLCGGQGTRLRPVFSEAKVLYPFGGKPFLITLYEQFKQLTNGRIILCTGYKSEEIEKVCKNENLNVFISKEQMTVGTGGAIINALKLIQTEFFVCINGDTYISECDIAKIFSISCNRNIVLGCKQQPSVIDCGVVKLNETLSIIRQKKINNDLVDAYSGLARVKTDLLSRELLREISFEDMISGLKLPSDQAEIFHLAGQFYDYGTPEAARNFREKVDHS